MGSFCISQTLAKCIKTLFCRFYNVNQNCRLAVKLDPWQGNVESRRSLFQGTFASRGPVFGVPQKLDVIQNTPPRLARDAVAPVAVVFRGEARQLRPFFFFFLFFGSYSSSFYSALFRTLKQVAISRYLGVYTKRHGGVNETTFNRSYHSTINRTRAQQHASQWLPRLPLLSNGAFLPPVALPRVSRITMFRLASSNSDIYNSVLPRPALRPCRPRRPRCPPRDCRRRLL